MATKPLFNIDMCLSEIESLADGLLYMHESAAPSERERIFNISVTLLYLILEKAQSAHDSSNALHRHHYEQEAA